MSSATEAVNLLLIAVAGLLASGTLANLLTDYVKQIPFPWQGEPVYIGGLMAELAALLISTGLAYLSFAYLTPLAHYLDRTGLWVIAVAAWPVARQWYVQRNR